MRTQGDHLREYTACLPGRLSANFLGHSRAFCVSLSLRPLLSCNNQACSSNIWEPN